MVVGSLNDSLKSPYRNVLLILVWQQMILKYRRTLLGYIWSLLNPLLMMSLMSVVFATLFHANLKEFTIFLFAGMIPWNFFNASITQTANVYMANESIIKKIYIPKLIFPLSSTLSLLIDNALAFITLFLIMLLFGAPISKSIFFIPIAYLLLFVFTLGLVLIVSVATIFFRDLQHIIVVAMQALFYMTPIFYKKIAISGILASLINLNPITTYVELFRYPLYLSIFPDNIIILKAIIYSTLSLFMGLIFFQHLEKKLIFRL